MKILLEERLTANKRVRVETLRNGKWSARWNNEDEEDTRHGNLHTMIQAMADDGYNFAGKINEYIPTGTLAAHTEDFLFISKL